uniref:Calcitonin gene-related peptide type 1 receptor-like n=1 Tax=Octopus vulgaris TaxID=6645 RepID=A0A6C0PN37_OCTVU|nr:calcitonin gene-related peptide type 1 receptor-like [Octopus vulgaris]
MFLFDINITNDHQMRINSSNMNATPEELCLDVQSSTDYHLYNDSNYCERIFDGFLCWEKTKPGKRAFMPCPFNPEAFAFKDCLPNGTWFRHPISNVYWTNYTPCFRDVHLPEIVASVFIWGHVVSIIALTLSMAIFSYFSQLNCARVTIHKHLFLTYILSGSVWIIEFGAIVSNGPVLFENSFWCRLVHVLTQYMTTCNYYWMFCEGLFMNVVIIQTFTMEHYLLKVCCVLGWVVPVLPASIYAVVRHLYGDNSRCWTGSSPLQWIIQGPVIFSLICSFILSINILRVLISKLRATNTDRYHQMRRSIRAILFLIPLLGLHFLIMPLHTAKGSQMEYIYSIFSAILISFQGLFVAILLCFVNEEVISVVRRKVNQYLLHSGQLDIRQSNISSAMESTALSPKKPLSHVDNKPIVNLE